MSTSPGGTSARSDSSNSDRPLLTSSVTICRIAGPIPLVWARVPSARPVSRSPPKPRTLLRRSSKGPHTKRILALEFQIRRDLFQRSGHTGAIHHSHHAIPPGIRRAPAEEEQLRRRLHREQVCGQVAAWHRWREWRGVIGRARSTIGGAALGVRPRRRRAAADAHRSRQPCAAHHRPEMRTSHRGARTPIRHRADPRQCAVKAERTASRRDRSPRPRPTKALERACRSGRVSARVAASSSAVVCSPSRQ